MENPLITTKACKLCKQEKNLSLFYKSKTCKLGVHTICKQCYFIKYNNCRLAYMKKDGYLPYQREYRKSHHEQTRASNKKSDKKGIDNLADWYVRRKLGLKSGECAQELIDAKRAQILIKRELKKMKAMSLTKHLGNYELV